MNNSMINNFKTGKRITKQYGSSIKTDKVFRADAEFEYSGIIDKNIKFIEKAQVCDADLWALLTNQYKIKPDNADTGWRGEYWGKIMRGACEVYAYTKSEELYKTLEATVIDMIGTADENGRISTYVAGNEFYGWDMWCRKYVLMGLLHFYDICKDEELKNKILNAMCKHADYILKFVGDGLMSITETSTVWGAVNSCSVLEPMVRLYNLSGDEKYLKFAKHIVDNGMSRDCDLIELSYENDILPFQYPVIKAYEMMSCFEGLIEYYRVTGIEKHKIATENFVNALIDSEDTVIGCLGCMGEHFDNSKVTQAEDEHPLYMQETCVTVTFMKLCYQMYRLTGDIKYIEQIEKSYYNAMVGSVNTELAPNAVCVFPFDSYSPIVIGCRGTGMENGMGGLKDIGDTHYGCCAVIGAMGLGMMPHISAVADCDGIRFDFYESGSIILHSEKGDKIEFIEKSSYPTEGKISFDVVCDKPQNLKIKFRIPKCGENAKVIINGDSFCASGNTYFDAEREWKNGDKVEIIFEMSLKKITLKGTKTDKDKKHICFKYGPLVLARDLRFDKKTGKAVKDGEIDSVVYKTNGENYILSAEIKLGDETLKMIDYSSAGKTLNEDSIMEVWLSVE